MTFLRGCAVGTIVSLGAAVAACSSSGRGAGSSASEEAGAPAPAPAPAPASGDASVPFEVIAPWKASSVHVELKSFGYFVGSMGYAKDRAGLTPAQLQALEGLRTRPNDKVSGNGGDYEIEELTIVDADGTSATYTAAEQDLPVALTAPATATLQYATLAPLLATLACQKAKSVCGVAPGGPAPATCTATVTTDPGCLNGVFVGGGCEDAWMTLTVPTAGAYEIQTVNCIESIGIELKSADGASLLASAAPSPKPACSSLTHTFDAAGTYRIVLEKRNAAGCAAGVQGNAGDFYVRVSPKP